MFTQLSTSIFCAPIKRQCTSFFFQLSEDHQHDFHILVDAFRQNYTTNVEILKARPKAARQQPGHDVTTFHCNISTLARSAHRDNPHLLKQIVVTSFIEGINNSTL